MPVETMTSLTTLISFSMGVSDLVMDITYPKYAFPPLVRWNRIVSDINLLSARTL